MLLQEWFPLIIAGVVGLVLGILLMLIVNKVRSGSASPAKVKQEMQDYQQKVEAHFEATSAKFKDMTMQYQDLYQHLATGATELCRAEKVSPLLSNDDAPLNKQLEQAQPKPEGSLGVEKEEAKTVAQTSQGKEPKANEVKATEVKAKEVKGNEPKKASSESATSAGPNETAKGSTKPTKPK